MADGGFSVEGQENIQATFSHLSIRIHLLHIHLSLKLLFFGFFFQTLRNLFFSRSLRKQNNLLCRFYFVQEILSKRLYLCQLLVSLCIVREGGVFFCKLFDVFTPFRFDIFIYSLFVSVVWYSDNIWILSCCQRSWMSYCHSFSAGLIYLMYVAYDQVTLHKPHTSRPANSERCSFEYLILWNYLKPSHFLPMLIPIIRAF